jgi:hypothetical protein
MDPALAPRAVPTRIATAPDPPRAMCAQRMLKLRQRVASSPSVYALLDTLAQMEEHASSAVLANTKQLWLHPRVSSARQACTAIAPGLPPAGPAKNLLLPMQDPPPSCNAGATWVTRAPTEARVQRARWARIKVQLALLSACPVELGHIRTVLRHSVSRAHATHRRLRRAPPASLACATRVSTASTVARAMSAKEDLFARVEVASRAQTTQQAQAPARSLKIVCASLDSKAR